MYVLNFGYCMIWHVIIFGYNTKLHIIITKCHTLYFIRWEDGRGKRTNIAYRAWQFSAEDARM